MKFKKLCDLILKEDFKIINDRPIAKNDVVKGNLIGIAKYSDTITVLGKTISSSKDPNVKAITDNDKVFFIALTNIVKGERLTVAPEDLLIKPPSLDDTVKFKIKPLRSTRFVVK